MAAKSQIVDCRELYFLEGIHYIPRILELIDRNRLSSTYGCFDRGYWHYRTSEFPSGMCQEAVLPLAIAFSLDHPENRFFQEARLLELTEAGIDFARRSSHADGSCDDYFPFERASGAAAFSLYACTEACLLSKLKKPAFVEFFKKRGAYLAGHGYDESGILSNHKALFVLCLYNVFLVSGDVSFKKYAEKRLDDLLSLQTVEGWFPEYEGCDPGYLTFTIDFLAKYFQKSGDEKVTEPLRKAIEFSSYFMHPDGSYGGEYGSRNTFHFLPHGYELMGNRFLEATPTADLFLEALRNKRRCYIEDDRIFCHYAYNFLQAYIDFCPRRGEAPLSRSEEFTRYFKEAGILVKSHGNLYSVISISKGGVAKIFREKELCWSDCGFVGKTVNGRVFISQEMNNWLYREEKGRVIIEGFCFQHQDLIFTPVLFILFRIFLLFVGRFLPPNVVRSILQRKAIVKRKKKFPLRFKKVFSLEAPEYVEYTFYLENPHVQIKELWIGSDSTFIYVATSQPYQPGNLKEWVDLSDALPDLNERQRAVVRREIP